MASTAFNDITSPFDKPKDLSLKANQDCWLFALTASSNHIHFDVLMATATSFLELLQDKSECYRWGPLMSVPIDGDGLFDKTPTMLSGGNKVMDVNIRTRVNLLTHWTTVSTKHCQRFDQWFNGADNMKLDAPFGKAFDQTIVRLDCLPTDNIGLVGATKSNSESLISWSSTFSRITSPPLPTRLPWPTRTISPSRTRRPVTSFTAVSSCYGRCSRYLSPRPSLKCVIVRSSWMTSPSGRSTRITYTN